MEGEGGVLQQLRVVKARLVLAVAVIDAHDPRRDAPHPLQERGGRDAALGNRDDTVETLARHLLETLKILRHLLTIGRAPPKLNPSAPN